MKNKRINVLFIVNSLHFGGAEKHVVTLLNHLDSARFRLSLAYLKNEEALLPQLDHHQLEGRVFCCDVNGKLDLCAVRQLAGHLQDEVIDIVVCTNTYALFYGWLARFWSGCAPRLVEVFHSSQMDTLRDKLQMLFYRPLFMLCDMLVYVCENQRAYWRAGALRAKRDTVIHNGIDMKHFVDRYAPNSKYLLRQSYGFYADDYVIGLCAALRPEKAHGDLLHAVARLKAVHQNVKCLFIGDGPERSRIEKQIEALGLTQQVRITGFIDDVRPIVAACDVMALVSHNETFSLAALEAMALGKPMIMSRIGGAAEQLKHGENGYLYDCGNIDALADALQKLDDKNQRAQMGDRARSMMARRFSIYSMIDAYERLFFGMMDPTLSGVEHGNIA